MANSSDDDSTTANSSNPASPNLDRPSVSRSSNLVSPKREPPTGANSSNPVPPNLKNQTMANSSHQPFSPEQELPDMTNSLDPASPRQERSTLASSSNQPSPKRGRPDIADPSDQASPKQARITPSNVKSVSEDRLSTLPERALIRILEHLPLSTAITVSRLSRRWFRLWLGMSKLSFDQSSHPAFRDFSNFASFVDATLLLCHPNVIRAVSFSMYAQSDYYHKLRIWLGFIDNNNVTELELSFGITSFYGNSSEYVLPMTLCFNSCIEKLKLASLHIKIPTSVYWKSLRFLSLEDIGFPNNDMMAEILAGCPALEELDMNGCGGVNVYDFSSAVCLKKFSMIGDESEPNVHIYCGNLQSLVIHCLLYIRMYYLYDSPFLREVVLMCGDIGVIDEEFVGENYVKDIISSLLHVDKLTIGGSCLEAFACFNDKSLPSPLPRLRNLVVRVHFTELDMLGLAAMLRSCPSLETLTIELDYCPHMMCRGKYLEDVEHELEPMEKYWMSQDISAFKCLRTNLKIVKVMRFGSSHCEEYNLLQFLEFVLKHALMLEELLVIGEKACEKACESEKTLKRLLIGDKAWEREKAEKRLKNMAPTLLRFRRSSPFARIVFY